MRVEVRRGREPEPGRSIRPSRLRSRPRHALEAGEADGRGRPSRRGGGRPRRAALARRPRPRARTGLALPRPGVHRRRRLHRPGQLRHQHRRRSASSATCCSGWWSAANLIAMLVQTQSAKLGIATGKNLPELCRATFSRRTSIGLWIQAEVVAMSTDVAEVVGAALGPNLLFGIPLFAAGADRRAPARSRSSPSSRWASGGSRPGSRCSPGVVLVSFGLEIVYAQPECRRRGGPPPGAGLRRHRERPAGHRDHRRDGDAARRSTCTRRSPSGGSSAGTRTSGGASSGSRRSTW